jgi:hypothetical protein
MVSANNVETQRFIELVQSVTDWLYNPNPENSLSKQWERQSSHPTFPRFNQSDCAPVVAKLINFLNEEMNLGEPAVTIKRLTGSIQFEGMPEIEVKRCRPVNQLQPYLPDWIFEIKTE